jgi:hypothetical protein
VTTLLACGRAPLLLAPAPALPAIEPVAIESTLFLIGDAGGVKAGGDRVMRELIRQGRAAPRASAIVFLGDNIYPAGLPRPGDAGYGEARRRLLTQASVADSTGLPVYFVPGNHDWDRQGRHGWAAVQRSGRLLRDYARDHGVRVAQLPDGGCPGPEVVPVGKDFRLVLVDTQWWLHGHARPGRATEAALQALPDPDVRCAIGSEPALLDSLTKIFGAGGSAVDVMVGHHPFESHGDHGGYHPWLQWILPAAPTPIAPWAWLPIGWVYPLARRAIANAQDQFSEPNRAMVRALEGTFQPGRPFVYASGHEHTLEVIRRGENRYYLVSGSGYEEHQSSVGRGDSTAFAASRPGFMRLDVLPPGSIRLGVTVIDRRNQAKEAYQAWLRQ